MRAFEIFDPLEEGTPVQYVGVYVLRWRSEWGEPSVGFAEIEDDTATLVAEAYAEDQARQIVKLENEVTRLQTENTRLAQTITGDAFLRLLDRMRVVDQFAKDNPLTARDIGITEVLDTISEVLNRDSN